MTILVSTPANDIIRLFLSATLNSQACYSRVDSDWVFLSFISWRKIVLKVFLIILFICPFITAVVKTIENHFF